eukprot:277348_1
MSACLLLSTLIFNIASAQTDTISLLKRYPNSFITRSGSKLQIEGNNIRLAGANIYWLGLDENGSPGIAYPTTFRVNDAISTAVYTLGATVIRAHTLGISTGQKHLSFEDTLNDFTTSGINHIDHAIYIAKQHNVRLVIPLTDNWHYYHGGELTFCNWRGTNQQAQFYSNNTIINDFKTYINKLLTHVNNYTGVALKDEPTILAWETGNELGQSGTPMPPSWSQMICEYIKSITSKQLVLDGRSGINSEELKMDCFDIYSQHYYPMNINTLQNSAKQVEAANKVFFAGEYAWTNPGGTHLGQFLNGIEASTTSMDCYWSVFPHNDSYGFEYHDDSYSMYYPGNEPGNNQEGNIVLLRNHAYNMAGVKGIPNYPLCGTPMVSNVSGNRNQRIVYWRGGYGCFDYKIERNDKSKDENDNNWVSLVTGVSDFKGYWQDTASIASNQPCTYYRIQGENYDKKYSNYSDVYSFCF